MLNYPKRLRMAMLEAVRRHENIEWLCSDVIFHEGDRFNEYPEFILPKALQFFGSIFDLHEMPSSDQRCNNAYDDMHMHTVANHDWSFKDILCDPRFDPLNMTDEQFDKFLRTSMSMHFKSEDEVHVLGNLLKPILESAGYCLFKIVNYTVFQGLYVGKGNSQVSNQGRAHSQNIASIEHQGLLFRSQPEVQLYDELVKAGYLFAPLPVFVHKRENHKFLRCELDFVIVRYGIWAVVEVDGEGFHHETPAQAYERLESFQDQGVKIIRVKANIASGPQWAKDVLAKIDERFEYFRNSR